MEGTYPQSRQETKVGKRACSMLMMMIVILLVMMMMTIAHLYINLIERPSVDLTVHLTWRFNSLKFARHSD